MTSRGHPGSPRDPPWLLQILFGALSVPPYWALLSPHSSPAAPTPPLHAPPSAQCSLFWLKIMPSALLITADRLIHTVSSKSHTGILPLYSMPAFSPWLHFTGGRPTALNPTWKETLVKGTLKKHGYSCVVYRTCVSSSIPLLFSHQDMFYCRLVHVMSPLRVWETSG